MIGFMLFLIHEIKSLPAAWRNAAKTVVWGCLALGSGPSLAASPTEKLADSAEKIHSSAQVSARATDSRVIKSVFIRDSDCHSGLEEALQKASLRTSDGNDTVDIILTVKLHPQAGWFTHWAWLDDYFNGFFTQASYRAQVIGHADHVLLTLHGEERALSGREMCQDIADTIADRLTQRE